MYCFAQLFLLLFKDFLQSCKKIVFKYKYVHTKVSASLLLISVTFKPAKIKTWDMKNFKDSALFSHQN